ncbi:hypothetical protein G7047_06125 [Diaphorobacter sp. HDW4A]|uniref:hypothetical protein n=1 Tax=Diaphorobacter sp. HDW4A TaxID=2714924 RepID=UPI001408EC5D|nr:hypothetical protein [Diaphorobacter sp. HDW4A]QIL79528.1 hypothetical protein G7047_06125 [Diaphorobacter sp. HDW4A]
MKKFVLSVAGLLAYVILAVSTYYLYIHYRRVDVVFYSAIAAALIALIPYSLLLCATPFKALTSFEKLQSVAIAALTGYALAISVPTVIDRSLSFYLIEKLQQRGGGIQRAKIDQVFKDEYVREHRLMDIRLTEQVASGTIVIRPDGCIKLTERGQFLSTASRFFRRHFLPKERLINGAYTDDLVDPFAHSAPAPDYLCR